jgi:hypothetical protein
MKREKLEKLATEKSSPCITISINTHRTHPENLEDIIQLKNLLNEAEERILKEFGNPQGYSVIEKIGDIEKEIDVNYNLESLHIFLSDATKEIVKSIWPTKNCVHIADHFTVKPLIRVCLYTENVNKYWGLAYYVLKVLGNFESKILKP